MSDSGSNPNEPLQANLVSRPPAVLRLLSNEQRWEVTRRHPYYLMHWETARNYRRASAPNEVDRLFGEMAVLNLLAIGFTGEPLSPDTEWSEIEGGHCSPWEDGAIAPLTFRGLVGVMLSTLPPESRIRIGDLFKQTAEAELNAANGTDDELPHVYGLFSEFMQFNDPALDQMPPELIISINPHAPISRITRAVEENVRSVKERLGLSERRKRDDKFSDYLKVWDLREGWTGDNYDPRTERVFQEIGRTLGVSKQRAVYQYQQAFNLIVGHEYDWKLWIQVFGIYKTNEQLNPLATTLRVNRRTTVDRSGQHLVNETDLSLNAQTEHSGSFLERIRVCDDRDMGTDLMDIRLLVVAGKSNDEIVERLGLDSEVALEPLQSLRERFEIEA